MENKLYLYNSAQKIFDYNNPKIFFNSLVKDKDGSNFGLLFEKFFYVYKKPENESKELNTKTEWLLQLVNKFNSSPINFDKKLVFKRNQFASKQNGESRIFKIEGQFVTGIGLSHPVENGFLWHPTLGMPYLPGSAVKGLVRSLIETYMDNNQDTKDLLKRWFGTEKKEDIAEKTGDFIFFDALPVKPCKLKVEIMTPHMGNWYLEGGKEPLKAENTPGDWHSPVPVSYLVAKDLTLQFIILPRTKEAEKELDDVWLALTKALEWLGAGAKTAIGFGHVAPSEDFEKIQEYINEIADNASRTIRKNDKIWKCFLAICESDLSIDIQKKTVNLISDAISKKKIVFHTKEKNYFEDMQKDILSK